MSLSTTAGHLSHSSLELRRALQLEAHLQAAPVEQLPEYQDTVEQSEFQIALGAHDNVPDDSSPNADLITTFAGSMWIIPHPEVTVLDIGHTLKRKACFVYLQNVM
jgi:hypothetical protein